MLSAYTASALLKTAFTTTQENQCIKISHIHYLIIIVEESTDGRSTISSQLMCLRNSNGLFTLVLDPSQCFITPSLFSVKHWGRFGGQKKPLCSRDHADLIGRPECVRV